MKYKYKLREQEEGEDIKSGEEISGGGSPKEKIDYNLILTPLSSTIDETVKALENIENYGSYISNLRNSATNVNKAVEDHFGPNQRFEKIKKEKERGKPFPIKTKQSIEDFIKSLSSKPNLLKWEIKEEYIIFPHKSNPSKKVTKSIIETVMDNAGIKYDLDEKEVLDENINKVRNVIKEVIKENNMFGLDPLVGFKIYEILIKKYPQIGKDFNKSAFFSYLHTELGK
jgi:hypothetical protein